MKISMIAAMAENRVIGSDGKIPWDVPADMKYFMRMTKGKPVIMGRKTFESLPGGALPRRQNIVITRQENYTPEGADVAPSLIEALALVRDTQEEIMICGGGEVYRLALPVARRIYLTEIHMVAVGDATFPELDPQEWREVLREFHKAGPQDSADCSFVIYERKD